MPIVGVHQGSNAFCSIAPWGPLKSQNFEVREGGGGGGGSTDQVRSRVCQFFHMYMYNYT